MSTCLSFCLCLSACLSACKSVAPIRRISAKHNVGDFYETVDKFQMLLKSDKLSKTLNKDQSTFYYYRRNKLAIKTFLPNNHYCYIVDSALYLNNQYRTHCYVSIATLATRKRTILRYSKFPNLFLVNQVVRSALFRDITWRHVVIVYRRFGATYRPYLEGSKVQYVFPKRR
jgi:hypothetical protein